MDEVMKQLVEFATETQFSDLPAAVVNEIKRVLLDLIGCAAGGVRTDRGKIAIELTRRLGGQPESTIVGTGDKVSCANAAFANGELMACRDHDPTLAIHSPPFVIPAPLALAESVEATGKDLILAAALGLEISARIFSALSPYLEIFPEEADIPGRFGMFKIHWPPVSGNGFSIFGAAAGAGKILKLHPDKLANAMGIAGYIASPSTFRRWMSTTPCRMTKWGPPGWPGQGAVTAALLADMGYVGDTEVLDGDAGYWKFAGSEKWQPQMALKELGTQWRCHEISYKQYPGGW